jgi:hypothetical protein
LTTNNVNDLFLNQDFIRSGQVLQRSLYEFLSRNTSQIAPDLSKACISSVNRAQWIITKTLAAPHRLQASLEPFLSQALIDAPRNDKHLVAAVEALGTILPHVTWIKRQAQSDQDDSFVERHGHGIITGPGGLFESSTLTLGLALMAPDTCYPYHQHPPAEFYVVLSPGEWYREDEGWWSPGAGGIVLNPASCVHAMRSADVPLLALWGLLH